MKELQEIVRWLTSDRAAHAVMATLVSVKGSSYRRPGARLLVLQNGAHFGSISGGCLEEDLLERARRVAETHVSEATVYDTTTENDLVWGVGLGCHGIVRVLIEPVPPRPDWADTLAEHFAARQPTDLIVVHDHADPGQLGTRIAARAPEVLRTGAYAERVEPPLSLAVFGAGNDAIPLVRLATELGWLVTVADPRPAQANPARFPGAAAVITGPVEDLVTRTRLDQRSVAVIMTHHYIHDRPLLRALLPQPASYIGLLGPRKRAERILADIAADGFVMTADMRDRLHAPTGLDLGADGPEQVALAIVAEIQAVLGNRNGRPLRERLEPIHR